MQDTKQITLDTATLDDMYATQDLLQQAHDLIEANGFDINVYGSTTDDGKFYGCWIGTLRHLTGIEADPSQGPDDIELDEDGDQKYDNTDSADYGNGAELTLALQVLDEYAMEKMNEVQIGYVKHNFQYKIGRFIEKWGLDRRRDIFYDYDGKERQRQETLVVLREGLTKVYNAIEAAGGDPNRMPPLRETPEGKAGMPGAD